MNSLPSKERSSGRVNQALPACFHQAELGFETLGIDGKPVLVDFTGGNITSDAGLLLLREIDEQIGLTRDAAEILFDKRDARYTHHSMLELFRQRIYAIAAGYEDTNDCDELRHDPIHKMVAERQPISGAALASQPTLSRFENAPSRADLHRVARLLVDQFIASYDEAPESIILDFDDTDSRTHGAQQLALFNTYYRGYCYMPLHVYEGTSGRLVTTILKSSQLKGTALRAVVRRVVTHLRHAWPETEILFRGDGHFARPEVMDWIEAQPKVWHITGLPTNPVLQRLAEGLREKAKRLYEERYPEGGATSKVVCFGTVQYRARSWSRARRVAVKTEVTPKGLNTRFVVSDLEETSPKMLYQQLYCARGQAENYIKDHKRYLRSDKASCHRFEANQFRLFLHSMAYVLFDTLRRDLLRGTRYEHATFATLRLKLIKLGARVRELKTRIKIELPTSCPVQTVLHQSFARLALCRSG